MHVVVCVDLGFILIYGYSWVGARTYAGDLPVWPAFEWASNTTMDASSLFTEFGRWARALCSHSSSNISSKSSGVLSELLDEKQKEN